MITAREADEVLHKGLQQLDLTDTNAASVLERYIHELERWNTRLGLVNATGRDLIVRHILDSLSGAAHVRRLLGDPPPDPVTGDPNSSGAPGGAGKSGARLSHPDQPAARVADLGSGGGLPGIPLACFLPETVFDLVERSERKCGFLRNVVVTARLGNARVVSADVSEVSATYDLLVFRALSAITDTLITRFGSLLRAGGAVCAYKGRRERIELEIDSLSPRARAGVRVDIVPVDVPFLDEERNLLVVTIAGEP